LLRELRMARITVAELRQKLEAGENPVILDLRSKAELERDPSVIQGAIHLVLDEVEQRRHEFPHDRDIIVYCSCPNEATAAKVALLLQRNGFTRVRPLLGGIGKQNPARRLLLCVQPSHHNFVPNGRDFHVCLFPAAPIRFGANGDVAEMAWRNCPTGGRRLQALLAPLTLYPAPLGVGENQSQTQAAASLPPCELPM
jgi:rhodanese-related sulfurtransferase